jgi:hypothetical protein
VTALAWVVVGLFGLLIVLVLILGVYYPGTGADVLDWRPTRSPELEAQLELDDVDQMLEAQNERRRRTGRPELTLEDFERRVEEDRALRERHRRRAAGEDPGEA